MAHAYGDIVRVQAGRAGIAWEALEVEISLLGHADDGRPAFAAMMRLRSPASRDAVRALLSLPQLEARVQGVLQDHWLSDTSAFAGIWMHASPAACSPATLKYLRAAVKELETLPADSPWSLPAALEPAAATRGASRVATQKEAP